MGHLFRRLLRNLGGVTWILLTDLLWRRKNLLAIGGIGVGLAQLYAGVGLLFAGSFVAALTALLLGVGGFFAGGISFFDRPVAGGVALGMVLVLLLAGPGVVLGVTEMTSDVAADSLGAEAPQHADGAVNNSTVVADDPSTEDEDNAGAGYRDGDTASDGCGTNDGDQSYDEDNDRDNDGRCDE